MSRIKYGMPITDSYMYARRVYNMLVYVDTPFQR